MSDDQAMYDIFASSIEDLEEYCWIKPNPESGVSDFSYGIRKKPLADLTPKDLRMALTQQIGLNYTVPMAIKILFNDPNAEVEYFDGDLLLALLSVPKDYWILHDREYNSAVLLYNKSVKLSEVSDVFWRKHIFPQLLEAYERLTGLRPSKPWLRPEERDL